MPQLDPSSSHIARAPITVKPAGLICTAELYLVSNAIKVASSGEVPFTSTGGAQSVSFPITMPAVEGTYKVYIDVFSAGGLIGAFVAREDVVVAVPAPAEFEYSNERGGHVKSSAKYCWLLFECDITNPTNRTETGVITLWNYSAFYDTTRSLADKEACDGVYGRCPVCKDPGQVGLTLAPGESYHYRFCGFTSSILYIGDHYLWLRDGWGGESLHKRLS